MFFVNIIDKLIKLRNATKSAPRKPAQLLTTPLPAPLFVISSIDLMSGQLPDYAAPLRRLREKATERRLWMFL